MWWLITCTKCYYVNFLSVILGETFMAKAVRVFFFRFILCLLYWTRSSTSLPELVYPNYLLIWNCWVGEKLPINFALIKQPLHTFFLCYCNYIISNISDGDLALQGSLGSLSLSDLTPHGDLYRERFTTRGGEALIFNIHKYISQKLQQTITLHDTEEDEYGGIGLFF